MGDLRAGRWPDVGPTHWLILAELMKLWLGPLLLSDTALNSPPQSVFSLQVPFFFFAAICLLSLLFTGCCVPETKSRSLEQIEAFFHTGRRSFRR